MCSVLQILTPALIHLTLPKSEPERLKLFALADKPTIRVTVLDFFLCYLLLPYRLTDPMIVEIEMKGEGGREVGREGIEEKG